MEKEQKIVIFIGIAFLIVGAYFVMLSWPQEPPKLDDLVVCTQEARSCSDGSYVGRTGPNCEFAVCPGSKDQIDTSNWKTYRNEEYGFEINYPSTHEVRDYSSSYENSRPPIVLAVSFCDAGIEFDCEGFQIIVYSQDPQHKADSYRQIFVKEPFVYELSGVDYQHVFSTFKFTK